jgi:fructose-1,6-bisphosphatase/inositol monophosphatase family enzyme
MLARLSARLRLESSGSWPTRTWLKADGTEVTDVDESIEKWVTDEIRHGFTEDAIFSEEYGDSPSESLPGDRYWWAVDPVDGTRNLSNGLAIATTSIGFGRGRQLHGGAVVPLASVEIVGGRRLSRTRGLVGLDYEGGDSEAVQDFIRLSTRCAQQGISVRTLGCVSLGLLAVAHGALDAYVHTGAALWDYAGGAAIAIESGLEVHSPFVGHRSSFLVCGSGSRCAEILELAEAPYGR